MSSQKPHDCPYCDTFGGTKTYQHQARLPLNERVQCIDYCIHHIIAALNAGGVQTVSCCCGHKQQSGFIELKDGRYMTITEGKPEWMVLAAQRHAEADQRRRVARG